jgi:hypothetical protein
MRKATLQQKLTKHAAAVVASAATAAVATSCKR